MKSQLTRRHALTRLVSGAVTATAAASLGHRLAAAEQAGDGSLKGKVHHSVCKWCYDRIPLEDFCKASREIGLQSVELLNPTDFPTLKKHGLTCAMVSNPVIDGLGGIAKGFNRRWHHDKLVTAYEQRIGEVADAGMENLICFSGNRGGQPDEEGLEVCAIGLKRIMKRAEDKKVTIVMELLNSKIDHKDYQCDHTAWGVELCKRVGSERFKLLYDIYHMQIMEGDVIRTIRGDKSRGIESAAPYIAHYHTGGVPGRAEIDETQELYYPAIMKAILDTGFKGFVAQEFIPKREPIASLRQGVRICDV